jgi:hypothetical protein
VTGTIDGVDLNVSDEPNVKLRTSNQFMSANAESIDADQPRAASLKKGQRITLACESVTEIMGMPRLKECRLP